MKIRQRNHSIKSTKILQWVEKAQSKNRKTILRTLTLQVPSEQLTETNQYELSKSLRDGLMKNVSNKKSLMKRIQSFSLEIIKSSVQSSNSVVDCHLTIHLH